jgi:catechol 2,3-dioxygenase-like lactoylglutathione lyase family enzyme
MVTDMIKLTGLNHLALATGDMDKTIHFWRDLLGMRLVVGLGKPGYRQYFFQLSEKEEDLWNLIDKLEAADFPVSDVIDHGFIHSIYTYDPNGIPLEFSHNVEGVDIRKSPVMVDKKPSSTAMEGPDPVAGRWPDVEEPTSEDDRMILPGEGSGLFD